MTINNRILSAVAFLRSSTLVEKADSVHAKFAHRGPSNAQYILELTGSGILTACSESKSDYFFNGVSGVFFEIDEFLRKGERRIKPPSSFYVLEKDWYFEQSSQDAMSLRYKGMIELLNILETISDYQERKLNDVKLVVLCGKKLIISSHYDYDQMMSLDLEKISEIKEEFVYSGAHSAKKKDILNSVIAELYSDSECISLGEIAISLPKILSRLIHGYDLFVAEFSYEKIKSEVERDKLEFNTRLNKVFSDIQNQLLAIPAALLLVGSQLKTNESEGFSLGNLSIWLGMIVFAILMEILIRNQKNTLEAVYREVNIQGEIFREKQKDIYPKFQGVYEILKARFVHQCRLLWVVRGLVSIILGITTMMFLSQSYILPLERSIYAGLCFSLFYLLTAFIVDKGKLYNHES